MPGFQELVIIMAVAVMVLGPNRLPTVARDAARLLARFRREASEAVRELKAEAGVEGLGRELRDLQGEVRRASREAASELRLVDGGGADVAPAPSSADDGHGEIPGMPRLPATEDRAGQ